MLRRVVLAALAVATAGVLSSAQAQRSDSDKWVLLGTRQVDLGVDKDTIDVTKAQGTFKAVRLEAKVRGVEISKVQVIYGNGQAHNEDRRINLLPGERTRPIDLRGDERFVDKINLTYKTEQGSTQKAVVEVWGLQSGKGASAARGSGGSAPTAAAPASGNVTAAASTAAPVKAKPGDETSFGVLFGTQNVGFGVDRDVIRVGAEIGKFDKIRLRVRDNDIFINELRVIYSNGEPDTLAVGADVKQNSFTKWLNLKGDRFIKEIQMTYRSRPNFKGQAQVEAYGEYAEGWLGPQGEGRKFNQGWVLLGAQTAGFVGFDKDTIPVGRNEGGFKKIRLNVRDRAITLSELRVIYGSGQEDIIPIKTKVDAGSSYGPIDLKGGTRVIKEIQARYRSRLVDKEAKGKGRAIVEVWGQH